MMRLSRLHIRCTCDHCRLSRCIYLAPTQWMNLLSTSPIRRMDYDLYWKSELGETATWICLAEETGALSLNILQIACSTVQKLTSKDLQESCFVSPLVTVKGVQRILVMPATHHLLRRVLAPTAKETRHSAQRAVRSASDHHSRRVKSTSSLDLRTCTPIPRT